VEGPDEASPFREPETLMARILLMSTKERGHLNPLLGVAQWLVRRGHAVGWLCLPRAPSFLGRMGIEPISLEGAVREPDGFVTGGKELAELVRQPDRLRVWIEQLLLDSVRDAIEPVRREFRRWKPGALVADPMIYAGILAAHLEKIPYACVSSSLNPVTPDEVDCPHARNMRALDPRRKSLFAEFGLRPEFRVADCLSPRLNTVFTTPEYVGADAPVPPNTFLVGPSIAPDGRGEEEAFLWGLLDRRPLVYVSFGSQIYWQPEIFSKVAEAARKIQAQVVLSCGDLAGSAWARSLPSHVVAVNYAPQLGILERAKAIVTHGGANSVMEALRAGVPILVNPVCNDQPMQAWFLKRSGAGVEVDLRAVGVDWVAEALRGLLDPGSPERKAAARVSESYRARDGALRTAELVEERLL
jgi:MGT family glycosyltransferase